MYRLRQLMLLLGDLILFYAGLYLAVALRYLSSGGEKWWVLIPSFNNLFIIAVVINFIIGLYDITRIKNNWETYRKIATTAFVWLLMGIIYFYINPQVALTPKTILFFTTIISFSFLAGWRFVYTSFISTTIWKTRVIFIGLTAEIQELITLFWREPELGYTVQGIVAPTIPLELQPAFNEGALPHGSTMHELRERHHISGADVIILAPEMSANPTILSELYPTLFAQTTILDLADFYEAIFKRVPPFTFSEGWFVTHLKQQNNKIYDRFRLLIDYPLAVIVGLIFLITFPLVALAIKLNSLGPIFFKQERVGRLGQIFTIYKYRTMRSLTADGSAEVNGPQYASASDSRITSVGKILRRLRLDELPQFMNILRGEMGLIGPRPERPSFVAELTARMPFYTLRHLIKPGITGWAQLHRSYYGNIEENLYKLEFDLFYIKNRGLFIDLTILLRTVYVIMKMGGR